MTQTADTAVKRAWCSGVACPVAEDTGSESKAVKTRITTPNAESARRAGELFAMPSMKSRRRVKIHRPSRSGMPGCQLAGLVDLDWLCVMFFLG